MKEQTYDLKSTKIYSLLDPHLKSFCLSLYIKAGSLYEDVSENGISHLFEHILIRNLKHKYQNFYELLAFHGLDIFATTYKEFIRVTINGPAEEFGFATEVFCDFFGKIDLSKEEFEKEKKRIKAEIREKDERTTIDYIFNQLVWEETEIEKNVLGYCKVLDRISRKRINEFREECFSVNNFFIYVTGNVSQENLNKLKEKVDSLDFSERRLDRENIVTQNKNFFHRKLVVNVKNNRWTYIKIGFDFDSAKYPAGVLDLLYSILFSEDKALFHNDLSEEKSLVYSYDSTLEQYDNIGNIHFMFEVSASDLDKAILSVIAILNAVKAGNFDFESNLQAEFYGLKMELDHADELNWNMAYYNHILKGQRLDYSDRYLGRYNITKEQIIDAAKEIFLLQNMTIVVKGRKKRINPEHLETLLKSLNQ